ncbi:MAG: hypothetical protein ONB17_01055 [candidate division KSB1 bacterium]|nr:hypothetical protein [candidate division KSB1 bacterium]MDZ7294653.1 hypothetical protein [candidate division KSB1 bacterium]MDZ7384934.1 hypothetical protein [candidate division KSB1 bacterium]MDZ7391857.1 hypothetical protein [candidate division KSB1 bacterium]MDZ7412309.1 hypothetical protein [candidate division KSB1 bacterium]
MSGKLESSQRGKASGQAVAAFVCGLCALVFGSWCCCLWFPLGLIAMVLGKQEERAIAEGRSPAEGRALAQWGFWLGLAGVLLGLLLITLGASFVGRWLRFAERWSDLRTF